MAKVKDILEFLGTIAPEYMKEDWDRVGLNCGHLEAPVHKLLVALDPFGHVCEEAKELGADLLVTHHALIWDPGFITDGDPTGERTLFLIENGIAHINAHTNLDCAPGGVNDVLAQVLGLSDVQVIDPAGEDENGTPFGLLRCGYVEEAALEDFLAHVKARLGTPVLRYARGSGQVCKVAVGGGACAGAMHLAMAAGCDTFVTGDIKYYQFQKAAALGVNLIDAGHFPTEDPICEVLCQKLTAQFPDITTEKSEVHADCVKFL